MNQSRVYDVGNVNLEIIAIYSIVNYFIYVNFVMLVDIDTNDINCDESLGCMYNFFIH